MSSSINLGEIYDAMTDAYLSVVALRDQGRESDDSAMLKDLDMHLASISHALVTVDRALDLGEVWSLRCPALSTKIARRPR